MKRATRKLESPIVPLISDRSTVCSIRASPFSFRSPFLRLFFHARGTDCHFVARKKREKEEEIDRDRDGRKGGNRSRELIRRKIGERFVVGDGGEVTA